MHYQSFTNYLLYLLPNLLSYAFVVNTWIDRMDKLSKQGNTTGLCYYYGMIIKNVFFFTIPESGSLKSEHPLLSQMMTSPESTDFSLLFINELASTLSRAFAEFYTLA
jgi:hypothetical protein